MHQGLKPSLDLFIDTKALVVMLGGACRQIPTLIAASRHRGLNPHTFSPRGHSLSVFCSLDCLEEGDFQTAAATQSLISVDRRSHLFGRCTGLPQIRKKGLRREAPAVTSSNFAISSNSN